MEQGVRTVVCIENAKVVLENGILWDGQILVENDRIVAVGKRGDIIVPQNAEKIDAQGDYVGPGFVDIHNHGGNGYRFDTDPACAAQYFLQHGETTVLATLYYDLSKEQILEALQRVKSAMRKPEGANIGGCYMEGPYMNPKFGASPEKNRWKGAINQVDFTQIVNQAADIAKVWAVAPEREGIEAFVSYAKIMNPNATFAVGHSEATPQEIRKLKKYGLKLQTHCMDATGRVSKWKGTRGCGPDEACFLDSDMYAELICDSMGIHVCSELQQMVLQAKGLDKVILISDSFVSDEESTEDLRNVTDLSFDANGNLSGSRLTLEAACRNIMTHTNCGIAQAFLMAARNPARVIGMDDEIGTIEVGKKANLVFVDDMFRVLRVMLNGIPQQMEERIE